MSHTDIPLPDNLKLRFQSFVVKQPCDYNNLEKQKPKKKKKKVKSRVAFGSTAEKTHQVKLPTLPDYEINYALVEPNSRKAIIMNQHRTRRAITEISKSQDAKSNSRLPQLIKQEIPLKPLKPYKFEIKEYSPKMYDVLPMNSEELKSFFNNLIQKHKITIQKQEFEYQ